MSTIIATSISPDATANDTVTIGGSGDSVNLPGNLLTLNSMQDTGGNNTFVSDGSGAVTSTGLPGAMKFISAQTASGATALNFTGIDSTYDCYIFKCIEINPATDAQMFRFNASDDGGTTYAVNKVSSYWSAEHNIIDTSAGLGYESLYDLPTGASMAGASNPQILAREIGNGATENCSGELYLWGPSSTTYVKQFYSTFNNYFYTGFTMNSYVGGFCDTTSAINAIQFSVASGAFDGHIAMYGISKS